MPARHNLVRLSAEIVKVEANGEIVRLLVRWDGDQFIWVRGVQSRGRDWIAGTDVVVVGALHSANGTAYIHAYGLFTAAGWEIELRRKKQGGTNGIESKTFDSAASRTDV